MLWIWFQNALDDGKGNEQWVSRYQYQIGIMITHYFYVNKWIKWKRIVYMHQQRTNIARQCKYVSIEFNSDYELLTRRSIISIQIHAYQLLQPIPVLYRQLIQQTNQHIFIHPILALILLNIHQINPQYNRLCIQAPAQPIIPPQILSITRHQSLEKILV